MRSADCARPATPTSPCTGPAWAAGGRWRSEEHTSELQSRFDLVCRPPRSTPVPYTTLFRSQARQGGGGVKLVNPLAAIFHPPPTPGLLAVFGHLDAAVDAIGRLRAAGHTDFTVYRPGVGGGWKMEIGRAHV